MHILSPCKAWSIRGCLFNCWDPCWIVQEPGQMLCQQSTQHLLCEELLNILNFSENLSIYMYKSINSFKNSISIFPMPSAILWALTYFRNKNQFLNSLNFDCSLTVWQETSFFGTWTQTVTSCCYFLDVLFQLSGQANRRSLLCL